MGGSMIKFLIMDVDGTLTDGKIYMGSNGEVFKAFNVKDGCGIKDILPNYAIIPIIITVRESDALKVRCKELNIVEVHQSVKNKIEKLQQIVKQHNTLKATYSLKDCAYIGDDLPDMPCMIAIKKMGGIVGCPADAISEIRDIADYVTEATGGNGAVREFIEYIIQKINN